MATVKAAFIDGVLKLFLRKAESEPEIKSTKGTIKETTISFLFFLFIKHYLKITDKQESLDFLRLETTAGFFVLLCRSNNTGISVPSVVRLL